MAHMGFGRSRTRKSGAALLVLLAMALFTQISTAQAACGGSGERLCSFFFDGRGGCDAGLVDVLGRCQTPGNCGWEGQRLCFLLIDGRAGCNNSELVDIGGACTRPNCGGLGERACAIFGRNSCDSGLVEVNDACFTRGDCGAENQRACLIGERTGTSCAPNLVERNGKCTRTADCGALGQSACAVLGRNSCDDGLVEVNDTCFTRGDCGAANQRACLVGERTGTNCDPDLFERGGVCLECGALGQSACAIAGRSSCAAGLFEVNGTCVKRVVVAPRPAAKTFVFVRTDPPVPVLLPKQRAAILASAYDARSKALIKSTRIEIFQASYLGPNSRAPKLVKTCPNVDTCRFDFPAGTLPKTISFMARITNSNGVFETPIRLTDLKFNGAPVRMNVSAEDVGAGRIAEVSHKRTIDIVFFAGTGYEFKTPIGAEVFSARLKDELETMLGVSDILRQPSSLADNLSAVSFHVSVAPATVKLGIFPACEHSTGGPVAFGDAQGILHPDLGCGDWSVPGPFYSAGTPKISWHEMHHAAFRLSDEYCMDTVHSQNVKLPNVYNDQMECEKLSSDASTCKRIVDPEGCVDPNCACSTPYWRSDPGTRDVMVDNTLEQADDLRAINGKFDECRAGRC